MKRDLLEALGALAAEVYFDALERNPALFTLTGATDVSAEDRALPVLVCIDELIFAIDTVLRPTPKPSPGEEDLPF